MKSIFKRTKRALGVLLITALLLAAGFLQQAEFQETASANPAKAFLHQFSDIDSHPWGASYLEQMVRLGILKGYGENESGFYYTQPEKLITRAEFAALLARTMGIEDEKGELPFTDQKSIPQWARGSVKALYDNGIVQGNSSIPGRVSFKPQDNISRAEIVAMISRALASETVITGQSPYKDVNGGDWFYKEVLTASSLDIVNGRTEKTFVPYGTAKRVEVMAILSRFLEKDNGEVPSDNKLTNVVKDYYDELEDVLEKDGSRAGLKPYVTGELALGLESEGAGFLESSPLNDTAVRLYKGDIEVVHKSSRLAQVEFSSRVKMSSGDEETPDTSTSITEKYYLVKENNKWKIYASDIVYVDTDEE